MVKRWDCYAKTVGFHHEGADKIKTKSGAVVSLVVLVMVLVMTAWRIMIAEAEKYS